jgi:hypothetical protein
MRSPIAAFMPLPPAKSLYVSGVVNAGCVQAVMLPPAALHQVGPNVPPGHEMSSPSVPRVPGTAPARRGADAACDRGGRPPARRAFSRCARWAAAVTGRMDCQAGVVQHWIGYTGVVDDAVGGRLDTAIGWSAGAPRQQAPCNPAGTAARADETPINETCLRKEARSPNAFSPSPESIHAGPYQQDDPSLRRSCRIRRS